MSNETDKTQTAPLTLIEACRMLALPIEEWHAQAKKYDAEKLLNAEQAKHWPDESPGAMWAEVCAKVLGAEIDRLAVNYNFDAANQIARKNQEISALMKDVEKAESQRDIAERHYAERLADVRVLQYEAQVMAERVSKAEAAMRAAQAEAARNNGALDQLAEYEAREIHKYTEQLEKRVRELERENMDQLFAIGQAKDELKKEQDAHERSKRDADSLRRALSKAGEELTQVKDSHAKAEAQVTEYESKLSIFRDNLRANAIENGTQAERIAALESLIKECADEFRSQYTGDTGTDEQIVRQRVMEWLPNFSRDLRSQIASLSDDLRAANARISELEKLMTEQCNTCEIKALYLADKHVDEKLKSELAEARREIEVLRSYGNKDCTAQADEVLAAEKRVPAPAAPPPATENAEAQKTATTCIYCEQPILATDDVCRLSALCAPSFGRVGVVAHARCHRSGSINRNVNPRQG